jgi:hypothetical protein
VDEDRTPTFKAKKATSEDAAEVLERLWEEAPVGDNNEYWQQVSE